MLDRISPQVFLGARQRALWRQGLPILVYHSIAKPPAGVRDPFLYVSPERFDEQLGALRAAGYESASLSRLSAPPGEKQVVITFDDGCRNVFENAMSILARHRFHAIQFLVAGLIGGRNEWDAMHGEITEPLMDDGQIREWIAAGHEIGSHSLTHRNLSRLDEAGAREQIFTSKQKLEDRFDREITHFCYPHGRWTQAVRALVRQAGYATACTVGFGVNAPGADPFTLRRIAPLSGSALLRKAAHRLRRKLFPR